MTVFPKRDNFRHAWEFQARQRFHFAGMSQTDGPIEKNARQQQTLAALNDQALTAADLASLTRMRGLYEELTPARLSRLVLTAAISLQLRNAVSLSRSPRTIHHQLRVATSKCFGDMAVPANRSSGS
jgi:hypothetical protein